MNPYTGKVALGNPETYLRNYYKKNPGYYAGYYRYGSQFSWAFSLPNQPTKTDSSPSVTKLDLEQFLLKITLLAKKLIKSEDSSVRIIAVEILASVGTPLAESILKEAYKIEKEPQVKAKMLEKLGAPRFALCPKRRVIREKDFDVLRELKGG